MADDHTTRHALNSPQVVADLVDGEVIAVNLESGSYFALYGSAAVVWEALAHGGTADEIARRANGVTVDDIRAFTADLVGHGLLVVASESGSALPDALDAVTGFTAWTPLSIHTYTDLQDILLLDPVHDADTAGWPEAKRD